ncbi:hypothetical protein DXG01_014327 [Tephrocybe rancida]|nr:hypothetical protein DXG01_014327 [Tephrocybe rancida]
MKISTFFTFASLSALALSADIDTLRADTTVLVGSGAAFASQVAAFPTTPGSGTILEVQNLVAAFDQVAAALDGFAADAKTLASPISEADGLALLQDLTPGGNRFIDALQDLQARKQAIGVIGLVAIQDALDSVFPHSTAFRAAMAQYVFTGAALDAWNALSDSVINEEIVTILFF